MTIGKRCWQLAVLGFIPCSGLCHLCLDGAVMG
ncbi:hypothetical protein CIB84_004187 [Bambusicola thoracicus]|uniref:Uncharacterized protein n=1 Tax=Bambusicola thoracicus TaxID=9083 RepID=A0A2P4T6S3_BAMTH|nr:hypothetical protein CIB84_004187 [Bambusicola thoracicus]